MNESAFQVSENQLFIALKAGEEWAWRVVYSQHREAIIRFVIYHHGCRQDGEMVFRESLMVFYEKINRSSFRLTAKIGTYLSAISRNIWSKRLAEQGLELIKPKLFEQPLDFYDKENYEVKTNPRIEQIIEALQNLGRNSKELLVAWYFNQMSPGLIKEQLGFDNEETAVMQKNLYLSSLKEMVSVGI